MATATPSAWLEQGGQTRTKGGEFAGKLHMHELGVYQMGRGPRGRPGRRRMGIEGRKGRRG